jgi:hypothetical protein
METKVCKSCGTERPVNKFRLTADRGNRKGKLLSTCTPCVVLKNKIARSKDPETFNAKAKAKRRRNE